MNHTREKTRKEKIDELVKKTSSYQLRSFQPLYRSSIHSMTYETNGRILPRNWADIGISFSDAEGPYVLFFEKGNLAQKTFAEGYQPPQEILQLALKYLNLEVYYINKKPRLSRFVKTYWNPDLLGMEISKFNYDIAAYYDLCHFVEFLAKQGHT